MFMVEQLLVLLHFMPLILSILTCRPWINSLAWILQWISPIYKLCCLLFFTVWMPICRNCLISLVKCIYLPAYIRWDILVIVFTWLVLVFQLVKVPSWLIQKECLILFAFFSLILFYNFCFSSILEYFSETSIFRNVEPMLTIFQMHVILKCNISLLPFFTSTKKKDEISK